MISILIVLWCKASYVGVFFLSFRSWFVLCLACISQLGAGTDIRRYGLAVSIGPSWVGFTWRWRQNPRRCLAHPVVTKLWWQRILRLQSSGTACSLGDMCQHWGCPAAYVSWVGTWTQLMPQKCWYLSAKLMLSHLTSDWGTHHKQHSYFLYSVATIFPLVLHS
jgi:hypothetical protein